MMMFSLLALLLGSGPNLIKELPRDLASLLSPKQSCQQLIGSTDEAALIGVITDQKRAARIDLGQAIKDLSAEAFQTRRAAKQKLLAAGEEAIPYLEKAAQSADPEVSETAKQLMERLKHKRTISAANDQSYVKRLMAIRLLQQMKSKAAIPALTAIARGTDPTLAGSAAFALATIEGKGDPRPRGSDLLKDLMTKVPRNAGFVGVANTEKGSKVQTIDVLINKLLADKNAAAMMGQGMGQIEAMRQQAPKGLMQALGMVGNVRVDAIMCVLPNDLATGPRVGYIGFIFKGLYDPSRLGKLFQGNRVNKIPFGKHTLYVDRHDFGACMPDKNTFLLVFGPNEEDAIKQLIEIATGKGRNVEDVEKGQPGIAASFKSVIEDGARIGFSGSFSAAQKNLMNAELGKEQARIQRRGKARGENPHIKIQSSILDFALAAIKADALAAKLDAQNELSIHGSFPTKEEADDARKKLKAFDQALREMMGFAMKQMAQHPNNPAAKMFEQLNLDQPIFKVVQAGKGVTVSAPAKSILGVLLPSIMFTSMPAQAQPLPAPQPMPEPQVIPQGN